jgi:hypothetical protein
MESIIVPIYKNDKLFIIEEYHCYQLHTKLHSTFFSQD